AVGTFRIFVAVSDPEVTAVTIAPPTNSTLLIPMTRPIETALPRVSLTASTSGFGGGTNSGVVWTSSCGAVAGVGIQNVAGQFVTLVLNHINPNVVEVVARDRGLNQFSQAVTITATSVLTPSQYASRILTIEQPLVTGITISKVMESHNGVLTIPYGNTEVANRAGVDLRAVIGTTNAAMSSRIVWSVYPLGAVMFDNARLEGQNVVVTVRPGFVGVVSIRATGAYCGTQSNEISLEIVQESVTSVRVLGPEGMFEYAMLIDFPRPEAIFLPWIRLAGTVGGVHEAAAASLVWSSSCGGDVVEILGGTIGGIIYIRAFGVGITIITATHPATGFYGSFTIVVDKSRLYGVEILGDGVVREQAALLITLEYADGTYTLESMDSRQQITLSLSAFAHGNVSGAFIWTSSNESVVRISGFDFGGSNFGAGGADVITSLAGFITLLPYGAGAAIVRATSLTDPSIYAEFTIFVTRGTASCNIQDGILDLPSLQTGDVRIILICEHYFGTARMSHTDMSLEQAQNFNLPTLTLDITGAIFHGWSLSRGGSLLPSGNGTGNENAGGENGNTGNLPLHLLDLENGADTLLLFAVWYIPYAENGSGSNLARNIIIGTLSVAGVGAAGTAGYIAQSKIRARRNSEANEWTMD
ncbi:MAG: hypothetical protein FWB72_05695, partial [Firmicutes bacterium]|nr:hypothetical protein [Bacillota bacterium]